MKVTVHKFTVADSFNFSQCNSSSMSLRWDCARKAPFGKWRWLSIKMMLSFALLTNEIVKPLIIVKAAFVLISPLFRWKLRAYSSIELASLTTKKKQLTPLHSSNYPDCFWQEVWLQQHQDMMVTAWNCHMPDFPHYTWHEG